MKKLNLPDLRYYKNSSPVRNFRNPLTVSEIIKIALIGKLNTLLIGERGEGKTKLMEEINSLYFAERGIYIRARPDMKLREIFERFNIKKMEFELKEIRDAPFVMIDEINRAPAVIQNEFFHILDGYIEFENKKVILGNGYHLVFATANYEKEGLIQRYYGIFQMDASIIDRFNLIINLDHFMPSPLDTIEIIGNGAYFEFEKGDFSEKLKEISKRIHKIPLTIDAIITILYLRYGLSFCEKAKFSSKKAVISKIPSICEGCHRFGEGCGYIYPPSTRFLKSLILFSKAKAYYLKTKGIKKDFIDYEDILEDFSFLSPWNGIINDYFIYEKYSGDAVRAAMSIKSKIKKDIEDKKEIIKRCIVLSFKGEKDGNFLKELGDAWFFMREIAESIIEIAKREGDLLKIMEQNPSEFKKIAETYRHPFLLFMVKND